MIAYKWWRRKKEELEELKVWARDYQDDNIDTLVSHDRHWPILIFIFDTLVMSIAMFDFPIVSLQFAERPRVKALTSNFPNTMKQMC